MDTFASLDRKYQNYAKQIYAKTKQDSGNRKDAFFDAFESHITNQLSSLYDLIEKVARTIKNVKDFDKIISLDTALVDEIYKYYALLKYANKSPDIIKVYVKSNYRSLFTFSPYSKDEVFDRILELDLLKNHLYQTWFFYGRYFENEEVLSAYDKVNRYFWIIKKEETINQKSIVYVSPDASDVYTIEIENRLDVYLTNAFLDHEVARLSIKKLIEFSDENHVFSSLRSEVEEEVANELRNLTYLLTTIKVSLFHPLVSSNNLLSYSIAYDSALYFTQHTVNARLLLSTFIKSRLNNIKSKAIPKLIINEEIGNQILDSFQNMNANYLEDTPFLLDIKLSPPNVKGNVQIFLTENLKTDKEGGIFKIKEPRYLLVFKEFLDWACSLKKFEFIQESRDFTYHTKLAGDNLNYEKYWELVDIHFDVLKKPFTNKIIDFWNETAINFTSEGYWRVNSIRIHGYFKDGNFNITSFDPYHLVHFNKDFNKPLPDPKSSFTNFLQTYDGIHNVYIKQLKSKTSLKPKELKELEIVFAKEQFVEPKQLMLISIVKNIAKYNLEGSERELFERYALNGLMIEYFVDVLNHFVFVKNIEVSVEQVYDYLWNKYHDFINPSYVYALFTLLGLMSFDEFSKKGPLFMQKTAELSYEHTNKEIENIKASTMIDNFMNGIVRNIITDESLIFDIESKIKRDSKMIYALIVIFGKYNQVGKIDSTDALNMHSEYKILSSKSRKIVLSILKDLGLYNE